jgi:transcriptional regulator with XRE-family HTH domain
MVKSEAEQTHITLGDNIRCNRTKLGWSQEQLASATGLNQAYIGRVERAQENISVDNIIRIAYALNIDASTLFIKNHCFENK